MTDNEHQDAPAVAVPLLCAALAIAGALLATFATDLDVQLPAACVAVVAACLAWNHHRKDPDR